MPNDVVFATIQVRVNLSVERSPELPNPNPVILSSPIAFRYRRIDGSDVVVEFCPDGPLVEFQANGQPYRFDLGAVVDSFRFELSANPPTHIGDSER